MLELFVNLSIFLYAVGVFGSIVSCFSLVHRFNTVSIRSPVALVVLTLASLIPGVNYYLMWEALEDYHVRATWDDTVWENYKKKMSQVNGGRGIEAK